MKNYKLNKNTSYRPIFIRNSNSNDLSKLNQIFSSKIIHKISILLSFRILYR